MALADDVTMHEQMAAITKQMAQANINVVDRFAPQSLSWEEEINGTKTEFVLTIFGTKLLVVITQVGKIGSWVECSVDDHVMIPGDEDQQQTFDTQVLFGARGVKEYEKVYARRLMEVIYKINPQYTSILCGTGMKDDSSECFRTCVKSVEARID